FFFFFFQAEDGIRDLTVTGVQTCALPILIENAEIEIAPMADGGEGTAEAVCNARGGKWVTCGAHDLFGDPIEASYVWLGESAVIDRKSTRLNSSHSQISYAVFCLKKKKKK